MKYYFPEWMFTHGRRSRCYTEQWSSSLSARDIEGAKRAYPSSYTSIQITLNQLASDIQSIDRKALPIEMAALLDEQLEAIEELSK